MNDGLSENIKKKLMLQLAIKLQDHKENVFRNAPVSLMKFVFLSDENRKICKEGTAPLPPNSA